MALHRTTPTCSYCGKTIATAIYKNQSDLPVAMRLCGDTFLRWEHNDCDCKGAKKAQMEMKKNITKQ